MDGDDGDKENEPYDTDSRRYSPDRSPNDVDTPNEDNDITKNIMYKR